jgi:predicted RNA polymerase sigma factor
MWPGARAQRTWCAEERAVPQRNEFEDFYQASYGRVVALLLAVLGNRQEAEDAAQEAFTRALARWPRLSTYEVPEAWVRQVALRLAVDSGAAALRLDGRLAEPPDRAAAFRTPAA